MQKTKLVIFLALSLLFFQAGRVSAAVLFINSPNQAGVQKFAQGDEFIANVFLNTGKDSIDAVGAGISYPATLLELKEIRSGNSIINYWLDQPKAIRPGMVNFSGIITGGYTGTTGPLVSLVFLTKAVGSGSISFDDTTKVLLNDGKGTQAKLTDSPMQFSISKSGAAIQSAVKPLNDAQAPDDFAPAVIQNPAMFDGKYFVVFSAQDAGSGIDYYQVYETKYKTANLTNVKWVTAQSPYVLQDQGLNSYIYVRAVDKAGNGRIESVAPRYLVKWYQAWWLYFIVIVIILAAAGYLFKMFVWKKKK